METKKRNRSDSEHETKIEYHDDTISLYNQFKSKEWDRIELDKFAKDIGLSCYGDYKTVYNRIEKYFKNKINSVLEIKKKESINSFNKDIPELKKNQGLKLGELLFWKIIRNKSIYKEIFSNFKQSSLFNYERLYSVYYILSDFKNGLDIVRDKVKSNSYLSFTDFKRRNGLLLLCDRITNEKSEENELLFNQILLNYSNKYFHSNRLLKLIIENSNIYLFNLFKKNNDQISQGIKEEFLNEKHYEITNYSNFKSLSFILKHTDITINQIKLILVHNFNILKLKFKQVIKILKFLTEEFDGSFSKDYYSIQTQINRNKIKTSFKSIENTLANFTNEQFNQKFWEILKNCHLNEEKYYQSSNHDDQNHIYSNEVKKSLIQLYNLFLKISYKAENLPTEYYLFLSPKSNLFKECLGIRKFNVMKLFKYGLPTESFYHQLFNNQDSPYRNHTVQYYSSNIPFLFKMNNMSLIEKEFPLIISNIINYRIQDVVQNLKSQIISSILSTQILDYLFHNFQDIFFHDQNNFWERCSNLEILKHYEQLMVGLNRTFLLNYKNGYSFMSEQYNKLSCNPQVVIEIFLRAMKNPLLYTIHNNNNISLSFLFEKELSKKEIRYHFKIEDIKPHKKLSLLDYCDEETFFQLVETGNFKLIYLGVLITKSTKYKKSKIYNWIISKLENKNLAYKSIKSKLFEEINHQYVMDLNILNNKNEKVQIELTQIQYIELLYYSRNHNLDDLFDKIKVWDKFLILSKFVKNSLPHISILFIEKLLQFSINNNFNISYYDLLESIVSNGNLSIIKYINLNYSILFTKNSKNKNGLLSTDELKSLLRISTVLDNFHINEILLVYTNLTYKEFKEIENTKLLCQIQFE